MRPTTILLLALGAAGCPSDPPKPGDTDPPVPTDTDPPPAETDDTDPPVPGETDPPPDSEVEADTEVEPDSEVEPDTETDPDTDVETDTDPAGAPCVDGTVADALARGVGCDPRPYGDVQNCNLVPDWAAWTQAVCDALAAWPDRCVLPRRACTSTDGHAAWIVLHELDETHSYPVYDVATGALVAVYATSDVPEFCGDASHDAWFGDPRYLPCEVQAVPTFDTDTCDTGPMACP